MSLHKFVWTKTVAQVWSLGKCYLLLFLHLSGTEKKESVHGLLPETLGNFDWCMCFCYGAPLTSRYRERKRRTTQENSLIPLSKGKSWFSGTPFPPATTESKQSLCVLWERRSHQHQISVLLFLTVLGGLSSFSVHSPPRICSSLFPHCCCEESLCSQGKKKKKRCCLCREAI